MKLPTRWLLAGLLLLALIAGGVRAISVKRAQNAAAASTTVSQNRLDVAADDVLTLAPMALRQTLPITGTIKAVRFATIKARVAGELQPLPVREGDTVKAGQVLATIDPQEMQRRWLQAKESAEAARAQLEIAQRQWDINKALVDQGFISRVALDNSQASLQAAQATHRSAMAAADVARKSLDDTQLRAPFDGVVASRLAQAGERVAIDARLLEVVDPRELEVEVALSASESVDVRVGQVAQLQVEDRPQWVSATVRRISPSAQAGSRSVLVFLQLAPVPGLRHGLFVKGTLGLAQLQAVAVPLSAIRTDRAAPYVQAVEDGASGAQVAHRAVTPGVSGARADGAASDEPWVVVPELAAGTRVLRGALGSLREGLQVQLLPQSPPNKP